MHPWQSYLGSTRDGDPRYARLVDATLQYYENAAGNFNAIIMDTQLMVSDLLKVFLPSAMAFIVGILITPIVRTILQIQTVEKKRSHDLEAGKRAFLRLSIVMKKEDAAMGGIVVWASFILTGFALASRTLFPTDVFVKLDS